MFSYESTKHFLKYSYRKLTPQEQKNVIHRHQSIYLFILDFVKVNIWGKINILRGQDDFNEQEISKDKNISLNKPFASTGLKILYLIYYGSKSMIVE